MKLGLIILLSIAFAISGALETPQPEKNQNEHLAEQVRLAIAKGVSYLKNHQRADGKGWEDKLNSVRHSGGQTALALLALLNAGVAPDEDYVKKGLDYLRTVKQPSTYVRSLQTMVFVEAGQNQDRERIQENVKHLLKMAVKDGNKLLGWGYDFGSGEGGRPDNSNTQYALLALWVASQGRDDDAKALIPNQKEYWEQVRMFYGVSQRQDGGWIYDNKGGDFLGSRGQTLTMTTAGLSGLFMAQMALTAGREKENPVEICGQYQEHEAIKRGIAWISAGNFSIDDGKKTPNAIFYNLYGLERLGRLSGQRFLGQHDWYREGCKSLVRKQLDNGSWTDPNSVYEQHPTIATSFALLFLSKGRTPVLISKLAHGDTPRQTNDQDWNRRRNDLRHLVDFVSVSVFNKLPLAWQTFDMRRINIVTPEERREVTSELLQSPIVYITGHQSLTKQRRLTDVEKQLLKEYVENGGFILAVACCGHKDFSDSFQELSRELWPENELTELELDHPIWNMRFPVKPGSFGLKGIQLGCKTVAVLATENMCGFWEINRRTGEGETAFHLGANIVAYATGLEPPKARLTPVPVTKPANFNPLEAPPRGYFQIGQLIGKIGEEVDWKPAPQAMGKLMQHMREATGLDAVIKTATVPIDHKDLTKYKFLYMHGRKDFKFQSKQLERLRFNLTNGALLFADACCGKETFDKAFRQFIGDLFPKDAFPGDKVPTLVPIPQDDLLFSKELNGELLTAANVLCRTERGAAAKPMRPALEGVKIGSRWAVIYSKYDIGCALEKHQSADCLGYNYESALRLARAAVLYELRP